VATGETAVSKETRSPDLLIAHPTAPFSSAEIALHAANLCSPTTKPKSSLSNGKHNLVPFERENFYVTPTSGKLISGK
jgi:hypothetical protein